MKIVLTGATGFVGSEVLRKLMERSEVAQVTCLVRRPLHVQAPRVETVILSDFAIYDDSLSRKLADHDACVWALGGKASGSSDPIEFERTTHTFTLAFANAVTRKLAHPFHFCYLSGMGADPSEDSTFPWEKMTRHLKGRTERDLRELSQTSRFFSATSFRPAGILPASTGRFVNALLAPISIKVDQLAAAMIHEATAAHHVVYRTLSNRVIRLM